MHVMMPKQRPKLSHIRLSESYHVMQLLKMSLFLMSLHGAIFAHRFQACVTLAFRIHTASVSLKHKALSTS